MTLVRDSDQPIFGLELSQSLPQRGNVDWRLNLSPLKDAGQKTQGVAIVLDDLTERKKLESQPRLFERMVSPAVIEQLDPNSLQLGGKRTDITVLFEDVRGFTSFSETQEPEKLVSILNRYLGAMAESVLSVEGTIDKFMGDAIMSWFNAPVPQDHTAGLINVKKIASAKFEGGGSTGGGGGSTPSGGGGGGSAPAPVITPNFNIVGANGTNQLKQLQQAPIQAYVVSGEMSTQQSLDRNRLRNATL